MLFNRWFSRKKAPISTPARTRRFVPVLQLLERREVLSATFLVTNNADSGAGSLRAAIEQANQQPGADSIFFNIPGGGIKTITLQSALPRITDQVTIDGYQQASTPNNQAFPNKLGPGQGTDANLSVQLTGTSAVTVGLDVGANGTVVRGLSIFGFSTAAVMTESGATGVQVLGNFIGVTALGAAPPARNAIGVLISSGSTGNVIGGAAPADLNLISGNGAQGIQVAGDSNTIVNNLIGTTKLGNGSLANGAQGIYVLGGSNNTIGDNVISGNATHGVEIYGPNGVVTGNTVVDNYIGVDASGKFATSNQQSGVWVNSGDHTTISGNVIAANNLSKDSSWGGVVISGFGAATNTLVTGNKVGVAADGLTALGNGNGGVVVLHLSTNATIGGTTAAAANVIACNLGDGIDVSGASGTLVQNNFIGVAADGVTPKGNIGSGVYVFGKAQATTIGGINAGNIISGNTSGAGVIVGSLAHAVIQGNYIGLGRDGSTKIGNRQQGVLLNGDDASIVGGTMPGQGNVISGNGQEGVEILGSSRSQIQGNLIGLAASGTAKVPNTGNGVLVSGSSNISIGSNDPGAGNIISGNAKDGVLVTASSGIVVAGNYIGTDVLGKIAVGNTGNGVTVKDSNVTIGGLTPTPGTGAGNVISGNTQNGISVTGGSPLIQGNLIGTDLQGNIALPNKGTAGIFIGPGQVVTVGGTDAKARNVISGNSGDGVQVFQGTATIQGNYIGLGADGLTKVGNSKIGVHLFKDNGSTVGGPTDTPGTGAGNVISGNAIQGVAPDQSKGAVIQGNLIGTNAAGTAAVGNGLQGVLVIFSSSNVTIGGSDAKARNVISGNGTGVTVTNQSSSVLVAGNYIGTDVNGTSAVANTGNGVEVTGGANNTRIGDGTIAGTNVISGNGRSGIVVGGAGAGVSIKGNFIGTDHTGNAPLPNQVGITMNGASGVLTIGEATSGAGNVISGNRGTGVDVIGGTATFGGNFIGLGLDGNTKVGNGNLGVFLASNGNTIGAGNFISGNAVQGVVIGGSNNLITGTSIGTNTARNAAVPNTLGVEIRGSSNILDNNLISGNTAEGVLIRSGSNNQLRDGNTIGIDPNGAALPNAIGVHVTGGSNQVIGLPTGAGNGNYISGNTGAGVLVEKTGATGTTAGTLIQGNLIGVNLANGAGGVIVSTGATGTTVGGTAPGAGNVISGNSTANGVVVQGNASGTNIQGNTVGLSPTGTALPNVYGVVIQENAANTTVGGTGAGAGNIIGGNSQQGIRVTGSANATKILGNNIGLDKSGNAKGNGAGGILIEGGSNTTIGGLSDPTLPISSSRNVISGNGGNGITVAGGSGLRILRNLIGTGLHATTAKPNTGAGIAVDDVSVTIGSKGGLNDRGGLNVISGNTGPGIQVNNATGVSIVNNFIGLTVSGDAPLGNGSDGVLVTGGSSKTTIGGGAGLGNYVCANTGDGIRVGGNSSETVIQGNSIGAEVGGLIAQPNTGNGIAVTDLASITTIGGNKVGLGNVISGNTGSGVFIDKDTSSTFLRLNTIGVDVSTNKVVANGGDGVQVLGASVTIGGAAAGNIISGNTGNGVQVSGAKASGTVIQGNVIGINRAGTQINVANTLEGILVTDNANNVSIGGLTDPAGNVVSGNGQNGIRVVNCTGTVIQNNTVGSSGLGNSDHGIVLDSTTGAFIGGSDTTGNSIASNGGDGIVLLNATTTMISQNIVGGPRRSKSGNSGNGINVAGTSSDTTLEANTIAGNTANGVEFGINAKGLTLTGDLVVDNRTGVLLHGDDVTIQSSLVAFSRDTGIHVEGTVSNVTIKGSSIYSTGGGTGGDGILVSGGALSVSIGGTGGGDTNHVYGNMGNGIHLTNVVVTDDTQRVKIVGNRIGTRPNGTAPKNALNGIRLEASSNALIQGNVITGNGTNGVELVNGSSKIVVTANKIGVAADGTTPLPNGGSGVFVHQGGGAASTQNTIGGTAAGDGNLIGFKMSKDLVGLGKGGVVIGDSLTDSSQQNAILGNSIFSFDKSSVFIDLGNTGSATYDPTRTSGPNFLEPVPTLQTATLSSSGLTITGLLNGTKPNMTFRIEFFAGARFLGFATVTTNNVGNASFTNVKLTGVSVPKGTGISATATDADGNTTGFATAIAAK